MPRLALALLLPLAASWALADQTPPAVKATVDAILDRPDYRGARWGLLLVDTQSGEVLYERNPDQLCTPASVTKLFSGAAAMTGLGAGHVTKTPVYQSAGDLILVAQGDLTLGGRRGGDGKTLFENNDHVYADGGTSTRLTPTDPLLGLKSLAKQVKSAGIDRITGDVIIDDRLFQTITSTGSGPRVVSPIMVNDNAIDIIVTPGKSKGERATVTTRPASVAVRVDASVTTAEKDGLYQLKVRCDDSLTCVVRGNVPAGGKPAISTVGVPRPAEFARSLFIECLLEAGVRVDAPVVAPNDTATLPDFKTGYAELTPVAEWASEPFQDVLKVTLKVSHNLYASTFPMLLAAKAKRTRESEGMREQGKALKSLGIDPKKMSFGGGAGGSSADHVSARSTVELLLALQKRPDWPAFEAALPVLGVDGTLASVGTKGHPAKGQVRAKTGTLPYADLMNGRRYILSKALGGVMTTKSGRKVTFAIYENDVMLPPGTPTSREANTLATICEAVYDAN